MPARRKQSDRGKPRNRRGPRPAELPEPEPPQIILELPDDPDDPFDKLIDAHRRGDRQAFDEALRELWLLHRPSPYKVQ